jgi:VIT1/CCC1 family predicted Fe2+/Mn2+ transporter
MSRLHADNEAHVMSRIGWLRAAVLGANDGIVSTASLIVGIASSAAASPQTIAIAGIAGLVAGAMSMAAGEYVSVSSQSDTERAELAREQRELIEMPEAELNELTNIYIARGVDAVVAREVAQQLMAKDALGTHAREELGINEVTTAQPIVAALASAVTFAAGAAVPLLIAVLAPQDKVIVAVTITSLVCLAALGAMGAWVGGAAVWRPTIRVTFWGALAMALTAAIGALSGTSV